MSEQECVPNHHADYGDFAGLSGVVAAASMVVGRDEDARVALRCSAVEPGDSVIDVGCGPGVAARHAARFGATVVGVDPAPVMLRVARLLTWPRSAVCYLAGRAERVPVADRSAVAVWSIATVHHWKDLDAGLQEMRRVLEPGGRLVAIERRSRPDAGGHAGHGWTDGQADAFAARCRDHGFVDVVVETNVSKRRTTLSVVAVAP
jgi:ubiquinone/menaquinone biosynthesis C-methylase UbiE